ncbi:unnamed protein product [Brachionus calyciflorus]|uniref:3D domain-containing protein n=1 Tax=Brachionus calyciflorus TaxID=104777 RepID=A0A813P9J2_9BILA|nr:unnamed protein product [Brachionus calyciflorus]
MNKLNLVLFFIISYLTSNDGLPRRKALVPENQYIGNKYLSDTDLDSLIHKYLEKKAKTKLIPFEATFYSKEEVKGHMPSSGVRGSTLKDALVGNGLLQVAVDPKVIPMFTRFNVKLWDGGESVKAIALDVGGSVNGKIIDIFVDKNSEAILLGRKKVMVELENK